MKKNWLFGVSTWRTIPVSKWLVTPIYKPVRPFGRGTTLLRGLTITMVINHLPSGMILQVGDYTTQLCGGYNKPLLQGSLLNNQDSMESKSFFLAWLKWALLSFVFPNKAA